MDDPRDRRTPEQVLADAEAYGVDLTLIDAQLRRTPEERLRMLSENAEFLRELRRGAAQLLARTEAAPVDA